MKKYIIANLKMNKPECSFTQYLDAVGQIKSDNELIVCLPYTHLFLANEYPNINIAAQNMNENEKGAFTGEISIDMLKDVGVDSVIIGHSERRRIYHEDFATIAQKVQMALNKDFMVIFCMGESLEERQANKTIDVLSEQIITMMNHIDQTKADKILFCYEPIWSIGSGIVPTNEQINEVVSIIKYHLGLYNIHSPKVLYGGSVDDKNFDHISECDIDGVLVGGASKSIEKISKITKEF